MVDWGVVETVVAELEAGGLEAAAMVVATVEEAMAVVTEGEQTTRAGT